MEYTVFYIIVGIVAFDFFLEQFLSLLNRKHLSPNIPDVFTDTFDAPTYKKSQDYYRENDKMNTLTAAFSFVLIMFMLFVNGFAYADELLRSYTTNPIALALLFFAAIFIVSDILSMPFQIYDTFVIEEKYGFNKMTPKLFIFDKLKSYLLSAIIGGGLLALFIVLYNWLGKDFWLYMWLVFAVFILFMTMFYSNIIVPLFNKQKPLEDGELKSAIQAFAGKAGFDLENIYVIDGSKRSTKANAYFTGLGAKKRIVLYDTLINQLSVDEIVAVLAHEIGHYKKKHTWMGVVISLVQTGAMLFLLSLVLDLPVLYMALGAAQPAIHLSLIVFGILFSPISTIIGLVTNNWSRRNEFQADAFAASFQLGDHLISGLKKLSKNNLSNLNPHPWYVFFNYSHPPLLTRINAIKAFKSN